MCEYTSRSVHSEVYIITLLNPKNEVLYELIKFSEPVFRELFFKRRLVCAQETGSWDCAIRKLRFADDTFYYLGNDHAKIFIDVSDEAWMLPENWVESDDPYLHCLHFFSTESPIVTALCSANTEIIKRNFLRDIDSTLEAELQS